MSTSNNALANFLSEETYVPEAERPQIPRARIRIRKVEYELNPEEITTFGRWPHPRNSQADGKRERRIQVARKCVSRHHLLFRVDEESRWRVERISAKRGMLVNGDVVDEANLIHGTRIKFGEVTAQVRLGDEVDPEPVDLHGFVTRSAAVIRALNTLKEIKRRGDDTPHVLILGERGTGKSELARALHKELGLRGPFVSRNCGMLGLDGTGGGLPGLTGHAKGAYTGADSTVAGDFEVAKDGMLFLDELGDLRLAQQVALLTKLSERRYQRIGCSIDREIQCLVVAATDRNLAELMQDGKLRENLPGRFGVKVELAPLRNRLDDIDLIAPRVVAKCASKSKTAPKELTPAAIDRLKEHHWPDNVRELETVVRNAFYSAPGTRIEVDDLKMKPVSLAIVRAIESSAPSGEKRGNWEEFLSLPFSRQCELFEAHNGAVALAEHFGQTDKESRRPVVAWVKKDYYKEPYATRDWSVRGAYRFLKTKGSIAKAAKCVGMHPGVLSRTFKEHYDELEAWWQANYGPSTE